MPPQRRTRSRPHAAVTAIAVDILQTRQQAIPAWQMEQAVAIAVGKDDVAMPPNSDDNPVVRHDRHFRLNEVRAPAPTYPFTQGQRDGPLNLAHTADYLRRHSGRVPSLNEAHDFIAVCSPECASAILELAPPVKRQR